MYRHCTNKGNLSWSLLIQSCTAFPAWKLADVTHGTVQYFCESAIRECLYIMERRTSAKHSCHAGNHSILWNFIECFKLTSISTEVRLVVSLSLGSGKPKDTHRTMVPAPHPTHSPFIHVWPGLWKQQNMFSSDGLTQSWKV